MTGVIGTLVSSGFSQHKCIGYVKTSLHNSGKSSLMKHIVEQQ
jgi:hypothetical protein